MNLCVLGLLLLLICNLFHCDQRACKGLLQLSCICWVLLWAFVYYLFQRNFHGQLRRMYALQTLNGMFCKCLLSTSNLWCHLIHVFLLFLLRRPASVWEWGVEAINHGVGVNLWLYLQRYVFYETGSTCIQAFMLWITVSSWRLAPVLSRKWASSSLFTAFGMKSFSSGIRTLTPAYFLGPFALTTFPVLPPRDSVCLLWRGPFLGGSKQMPPALCLTSSSVPFDRGVENINSQRSLKFFYCLLPSCWLCSAFFPRPLLFNYDPSIIFSSPWPQGLVFLFRLKDSFKCFL